MKARWLFAAVAVMPFTVAVLALQSCGGEGGPINNGGGGGGGGGDSALVTQWKGLWTDSQKQGATYVGSDTCGTTGCHGNRAEGTKYETWHETKHFGENVGCESCHGPGSAHVASQSEDDILSFPKITNPVVCGQCHVNQYPDYLQSGHRRLLESPVHEAAVNPANYGRGSRCIFCHSGLARTEIYEKGVDAGALPDATYIELSEETINEVPFIASCATCHDPHAKTGNANDNGEEVQLRHPVFNNNTTEINGNQATPPVADVFTRFNHQCAECHNGRAAGGTDTKLGSTSRPNMHDSNQYNMLWGVGGAENGSGPGVRFMAHADIPGQCSTCHMPNSRHTFTVSYEACAPCHTPADAAQRKSALAQEMTDSLFALRLRMENWAKATFTSATPGYTPAEMDQRLFPWLWEYSTVITTAMTELGIDTADATKIPPTTHQNAVPMAVRRARHNYYFIVRDGSVCPHNPLYARYLLDYANQQMDTVQGSKPSKGGPKLTYQQKRAIIEADRARAAKADLEAMYNGEGD